MTKEIWSKDDELEYQIGDMNGIAFEPKPPKEKKIDSNDRPDVLPPVEPFYIERYEDKKK